MIWRAGLSAVGQLRGCPASLARQLHSGFTLNKGASISRHGSQPAPAGPILAIRREDASIWERRAPLAPHHVRKLVRKGAFETGH